MILDFSSQMKISFDFLSSFNIKKTSQQVELTIKRFSYHHLKFVYARTGRWKRTKDKKFMIRENSICYLWVGMFFSRLWWANEVKKGISISCFLGIFFFNIPTPTKNTSEVRFLPVGCCPYLLRKLKYPAKTSGAIQKSSEATLSVNDMEFSWKTCFSIAFVSKLFAWNWREWKNFLMKIFFLLSNENSWKNSNSFHKWLSMKILFLRNQMWKICNLKSLSGFSGNNKF